MPLERSRIGVLAALIGGTFASTAQAASDHELAVVSVAFHQECGKKHPDMVLSLDEFISLHTHMSDKLANHVREVATEPEYKSEVEEAVRKINTEADQYLVEAVCDSYYKEVVKR